MKWWIIFLVLLPIALATDNLYQYDSLHLQLSVDGSFEVIPTKSGATVKDITTELLLYPREEINQKILTEDTRGDVQEDKVVFTWSDKQFGKKRYGYKNIVKTTNVRQKVSTKIPYPIKDSANLGEYLQQTETIDSKNKEIIAKASELVEGEDDLFKAVFKLASWVEENIDYDLSTLTATTSQKASWVLKERRGVCDEMTSLFIAMARSVGIPARFATGISYTTSDLFGEPWQPHGWAEVYFPGIGWVGFDVTFNQYGYVDVTHIKLRDGFDPKNSATTFKWTSDGAELEPEELKFDVEVKSKGEIVPEEILLEEEVLISEVGFGSYNLIKGIVKNTADYYVATALKLSVPKEISVLGRNRRNILLKPKEVKETFWIVKVPDDLNKKFIYTFPSLVYSEKNVSVVDSFKVSTGKQVFTKEEIEKVIVKDEDKSYSRKVRFDCDYPSEMKLGEEIEVSCSVKNVGNTNLENVKFCLGEKCSNVNLPISQLVSSKIKVKGDKAGWSSVAVTVENSEIEKKEALSYLVIDVPKILVKKNVPSSVIFGEKFDLQFVLDKTSFQSPLKVKVTLDGAGFEQFWDISELTSLQTLTMQLEDYPLTTNNKFSLKVAWEDKEGNSYDLTEEFVIKGEGKTFGEKIRMFFNKFLTLF